MSVLKSRTTRRQALALGTAGVAGVAAGVGFSRATLAQDTTLTFANWQWLEPGRGELMWDAMTAFEDVADGITLEQQAYPRAQYESTIQTQIGGGGGPDILIVPPAFLYQAGEAGVLEPLDGVLSEEAMARLQPSNERAVYDGQQLGFTWEAVNTALFWNKAILEEAGVEPPTDVESLIAAATAITEATGNPAFAVRHQLNEQQPWWNDFASWPCAFGGGWSTDGALTIDRPENVEAVRTLKRLYDSGTMPIGDDASTFRNRFAQGEIAMSIDNASVVYTIVTDNDVVTSQDIGSSPLPFPTNDSSQVVNFIGINANSQNKEAAKEFIAWLFSEEGQQQAAKGVFPSTVGTDTPPPAEIVEANPWIETYREQAKHSTCSPLVEGFELQTPDIMNIVMPQIAAVLTQGVDPQEALSLAQQEAEAAIG